MEKAIVIDLRDNSYKPIQLQSWSLAEGLYYKDEGGDFVIAAYVFPIENTAKVEIELNRLKVAKEAFNEVQGDVLYQSLPKLREVLR